MQDHDPHDLERFVAAQRDVYPHVVAELARGRKASHWMWFVFPQLKALGRSATALRYGLASADEARAYLAHPVLGARLVECTRLMLAVADRSAHEILGSPDDLKFRSSMTLCAAVGADRPEFVAALARFYAGAPDAATLAILAAV